MNQRLLLAVFPLVLYNLLPLAGVIFWDWTLFSVLLLYWLESGVIGIINLIKIGMAQAPMSDGVRINGRPAGEHGKLFMLLFFPFHYGVFWIVHGVFVFVFFGFGLFPGAQQGMLDGFSGVDVRGVGLVAGLMAVQQILSFLFVFVGEKEYLRISPDRQMRQPYSRVFVLHGTIIGGAWLITQAGTPLAALALLITLKMSIDLYLLVRDSAPPAEPAEA